MAEFQKAFYSPITLQLQSRKPRHLLELSEHMADAQRAMVRGSLGAIGVDKRSGFKSEAQAAVGVADLQTFAREAFTFRADKFQLAVSGLGETQNRDGAVADACFHADSGSRFAVIKAEPAQNWPAFRNRQMEMARRGPSE